MTKRKLGESVENVSDNNNSGLTNTASISSTAPTTPINETLSLPDHHTLTDDKLIIKRKRNAGNYNIFKF